MRESVEVWVDVTGDTGLKAIVSGEDGGAELMISGLQSEVVLAFTPKGFVKFKEVVAAAAPKVVDSRS